MKRIICVVLMLFMFLGSSFTNRRDVVKSSDSSLIPAEMEKYYNKDVLDFDPIYNKYNLQTDLKVGDIIFEAAGGFNITHHVAVVESIKYSVEYGVNYVRLIEAVSDGVCYGILDDYRFDERKGTVLRLKENLDQKSVENILFFLEKQIGKPYDIDIVSQQIDINAKDWYCSSLVYAAYLYAGIDLNIDSSSVILPDYIKDSLLLENINLTSHSCVLNGYAYHDKSYHKTYCFNCGNYHFSIHFYKNYGKYKECVSCGHRIYEGGIEQICTSKNLVE